MDGILVSLARRDKRKLTRFLRNTKDAAMRVRCTIILALAEGESVSAVARSVVVSRTTVYKWARRYNSEGMEGLVDRRLQSQNKKADEDYLQALWETLRLTPQEFQWARPTWTRELLVLTLAKVTRVSVSVSTMSRALRLIGARRGTPRPTVACPWPKQRKSRVLNKIKRTLAELGPNEVAYYEDEVDIHLNPKIGLDWMLPGEQRTVLTPGKNVKRYLAGALNAETGELIWVEAAKKDTMLFIELLWALLHRHPGQTIHIVLDNYCIHKTGWVQELLETPEGRRLRLHFLPPYCPEHNRIERTWQDLHANVTRNHTHANIESLMSALRKYLASWKNPQYANAA